MYLLSTCRNTFRGRCALVPKGDFVPAKPYHQPRLGAPTSSLWNFWARNQQFKIASEPRLRSRFVATAQHTSWDYYARLSTKHNHGNVHQLTPTNPLEAHPSFTSPHLTIQWPPSSAKSSPAPAPATPKPTSTSATSTESNIIATSGPRRNLPPSSLPHAPQRPRQIPRQRSTATNGVSGSSAPKARATRTKRCMGGCGITPGRTTIRRRLR